MNNIMNKKPSHSPRFNALTHRDLLGHLLPFLLDPFVPALPVPTHEDDGSDDAKSALCERPPHPSTRTVALEIIHLYTFHNPSTVRWVGSSCEKCGSRCTWYPRRTRTRF